MRLSRILYIVGLLYFSCESAPEIVQKSDTSIIEEPLQSETYMYYAFAKDIPLGSNLIESDLKYYSYYGQFVDGKLLDFYTAEYPGFSFSLPVLYWNIATEYWLEKDTVLIRIFLKQ